MKLIIVAGAALFFGWIFGYMTCAVFSINRTNEEWEIMVEELEKGKWITGVEAAGEKGFACDQCKTFFPYKYYGETHRFCPHCGADMRREQNEHDGQRDKGMAEKASAAPTGDTGY